MPLHDYKCRHCNAIRDNLYFKLIDIPKDNRLGCNECGKQRCMEQFFSLGKGIASKSTQNGGGYELGYGRYHPQFGCIMESYSHKKELMKKFSVIETSDPMGGNRKWSEEGTEYDDQPDPDDDGGVIWGGDYNEIKKEMKQPKYHRGDGTKMMFNGGV